jgi:hypothetical protein
LLDNPESAFNFRVSRDPLFKKITKNMSIVNDVTYKHDFYYSLLWAKKYQNLIKMLI